MLEGDFVMLKNKHTQRLSYHAAMEELKASMFPKAYGQQAMKSKKSSINDMPT